MARKPLFKELEESTFDQSGSASYSDRAPSSRPSLRVRAGDSEEGKWIKRTNEQLKGVYGFVDQEDNKYISAWERVFEKAGLKENVDFVRKTKNGVDVPYLRNTRENRKKVDELRKIIHQENARSMKSIRDQAIRELKEEGRKATKQNIDDKLDEMKSYATLESNADFIYKQEERGNYKYSHYTDKLRGLSAQDPEFKKVVRDMAKDIKKARERERRTAQSTLTPRKKRLNENSVK